MVFDLILIVTVVGAVAGWLWVRALQRDVRRTILREKKPRALRRLGR